MTKIIRCPDGEGRTEVDIEKVHIPDLWHIAMSLPDIHQKQILEVWHLAHDLKRNIMGDV
jgi:hypothetical protein